MRQKSLNVNLLHNALPSAAADRNIWFSHYSFMLVTPLFGCYNQLFIDTAPIGLFKVAL